MSLWAMSGARLRQELEFERDRERIERIVVNRGDLVLRLPVPEGLDDHRDAEGYLIERVDTGVVSFLPSRIRRAEKRLLKRWARLAAAVSNEERT